MTLKTLIAERLQSGIPLVEHPYRAIAAEFGCEEATVLAHTKELVREGYVRSLEAFVDFERLGYERLLCGLAVPEDRLVSVTALLNERPEVTDIHLRGHSINVWLVAFLKKTANSTGEDLTERTRFVEQVLGACECPFVVLATEARLKARSSFHFSRDEYSEPTFEESVPDTIAEEDILTDATLTAATLNEESRAILRLLQRGFPVAPEPFELTARKVERSVPQLLKRLRTLEENRVLRKIGASLHPRRMGYNAGALSAWVVNDEDILEASKRAASFPWVSHCYIRKTVDNTLHHPWLYTLYTTLHAPNDPSLTEQLRLMKDALLIRDMVTMPTVRELKKTRYLL
jgi:DNA-binding Lrp family transcriptional regulator